MILPRTTIHKSYKRIAKNDNLEKNDLQGMTIYNLAKGVQIDMNYGWIMQGHHELSGAISH